MDKNQDGSIRSRCLDCEYLGKAQSDNNHITAEQKRLNANGISIYLNLS